MSVILILIISFLALLWAANHLVTGASGIANHYQLSPFILGLTVVGLGTTAPELVLSIIAAITDNNNLAIGNALGSNIANIGLVLGITMLVKPNFINSNLLRKTYPVLILAMLFVYSSILDGYLGKIDGCLFLIGCIALICFFVHLAHESLRKTLSANELKHPMPMQRSLKLNLVSLFLGLIILPISAKYVVMNAAELAKWSGMSELTIGLTIMAIGTSLPELATALTAALKGEENLALGTILGSNIYNFLLILSFPALLNPGQVNTVILTRDMPVLLVLSGLLIYLNFHYKDKLSRCHGGILILVYCAYIAAMVFKA